MDRVAFTKMQGLGNDFVVIDAIEQPIELSDDGREGQSREVRPYPKDRDDELDAGLDPVRSECRTKRRTAHIAVSHGGAR